VMKATLNNFMRIRNDVQDFSGNFSFWVIFSTRLFARGAHLDRQMELPRHHRLP
ncbi:unnamed protein product, partial [Acidithrix sp. C25]